MKKSMRKSSMWSAEKVKLAILVPTRDMVYTNFAYCLNQLVKTTSDIGIDTYVFFDSSTILLNQRNNLLEEARRIDADYVLWVDSDMMFPSTTAVRLIQHNVDIVACNYSKRTKPMKTVAYTDLNNWDSWLPMEAKDELVKVQGVGMGCMLMKLHVFDQLTKPYFEFRYKADTDDYFGEDFILLGKLRELGYEINIDTVLSMEIKHLGTMAF